MRISIFWFTVCSIALVGVAALAGLVPSEVPFIANTETSMAQREPDVAYDGGGRALIVWDSDASGEEDIAARLVGPDGSPVGAEFQINTYTSYQQIRPAVAGFPDGGFVVVWESYVFETEEDELYVRRVDSAGNRIGSEIRIDDSEFHLRADVAATADGGFVVVWDDGFDIFARRFDSAGGSIGDGFFVNDELGTMSGPRIAADADGAFVVVWEDQSAIDGDGYGVLMRRFDSQANPLSDDLQVNSTVEGNQYAPALASRPDGAFVVAWETYGQVGVGDGIFGQLFGGQGAPLGEEFRVDGESTAYAGYVDAAAVDDGFAVVWNEPREEGEEILTTLMRRIDLDGSLGEVIDVDPEDDGDQANASIAGNADGVIVAWEGFGPDDRDVFAQVYDLAAAPCVGDCNGDGEVSIAELIRAVNISLGTAAIDQCRAADRNDDGSVSISELIAAVNSSLEGCGE